MFDLIPCDELPFLMLTVAILGSAYLIFWWARFDPSPLPSWRWGDTPRREPKVRLDLVAHIIGGFFAALAVDYAINHPICG